MTLRLQACVTLLKEVKFLLRLVLMQRSANKAKASRVHKLLHARVTVEVELGLARLTKA